MTWQYYKVMVQKCVDSYSQLVYFWIFCEDQVNISLPKPVSFGNNETKRTKQTNKLENTPTKAIKKKKYVSDTRTHCYVNSISRVGLRAGP